MPTTPYLGIEQLAPNQAQKEVTINDAIVALEGAGNACLTLDYSSSPTITLSDLQFQRNGVFRATAMTADSTLVYPQQINDEDINRQITIVNDGGYGLTVKATDTTTPIVIATGQCRILNMQGSVVRVSSESSSASTFTSLPDSPPSGYADNAGKVAAVNDGEDGLVFKALLDLLPTDGRAEGKIIALDADLNLVWIDPPADGGGDDGGDDGDDPGDALAVDADGNVLAVNADGDTLGY